MYNIYGLIHTKLTLSFSLDCIFWCTFYWWRGLDPVKVERKRCAIQAEQTSGPNHGRKPVWMCTESATQASSARPMQDTSISATLIAIPMAHFQLEWVWFYFISASLRRILAWTRRKIRKFDALTSSLQFFMYSSNKGPREKVLIGTEHHGSMKKWTSDDFSWHLLNRMAWHWLFVLTAGWGASQT